MPSAKKKIKTLQEFTSMGGKAVAKKSKNYMRELGRKGGKANVKKHGKDHMREISAKAVSAKRGTS